jgi:hypothetical protein
MGALGEALAAKGRREAAKDAFARAYAVTERAMGPAGKESLGRSERLRRDMEALGDHEGLWEHLYRALKGRGGVPGA